MLHIEYKEMINLEDFQFDKTIIDVKKINEFSSEDGFMNLAVELLKEIAIITTVLACSYRLDDNNAPRMWTRNEAIVGGLLVRITKLQSSFLDQICQERMETAMILFRCLGESLINIRYLLEKNTDEMSDKFIEYSLREEKRLLNEINDNISKRGYELPIEQRMKKSINRSFTTSNFKPEDVNENNREPWEKTIYNRAKIVGMEKMYTSLFSLPSHDVHGNLQNLISNHLEFEDGEFSPNPDWTRPRPQPLLVLCILFADANRLFLERTMPDSPDRKKIIEMLEDVNSRAKVVDSLHEKFLQNKQKA
jgi:hypothetical protein